MSRTWLVTGGSRGLGRALCEAIVAAGDNLVATARDASALADLVARGGDASSRGAGRDRRQRGSQRGRRAVNRFGGVDIVVNNAGYGDVDADRGHGHRRVPSTDRNQSVRHDHYDQGRDPAVPRASRGPVHPDLVDRRSCRCDEPWTYSAAKFGVEGFAEALAGELAPFGVHVTIIEPGASAPTRGPSTRIAEGNPAYAETVGKTAARGGHQ